MRAPNLQTIEPAFNVINVQLQAIRRFAQPFIHCLRGSTVSYSTELNSIDYGFSLELQELHIQASR